MSAHKKRKVARADEGSSSEEESTGTSQSESHDSSDPSDSESEKGSDVAVDLEFFDPKESDFQGLKSLLHLFLDGREYDSSLLADTIIKQATVGSVVKTGVDGDPLGLITVLNTQRYQQLQHMQQILDFLKLNAPTSDDAHKLQQVWQAAGTGLMLTERLANTPPQLAPPLIQSVCEEIHWAIEDEPTQEERDSFKFKAYLVVSRVYEDEEEAAKGSSKALSKQQKRPSGGKKVVYARPEDEYLHKHAEWSYTFPVANRPTEKDELRQLRIVMCLKPAKLKAARKELDEVVGNPVAALAAA